MLRIPHGRLIALRASGRIENAENLPNRIVLLKWGENETIDGPVKVGQHTLSSLSANQAKFGFDDVVLDFNHNTVPGHPNNKGEPAFIAATGQLKVLSGEGLVLENIKWTDKGKEHVAHYPDLSPAVQLDDSGEVIFCHSAALCRQGKVKDLHVFSVSFGDQPAASTTTKPAVQTMQTIVVSKNAVDLDRLRKILSLSAEATVEDINQALVALEATPDKPVAGLTAEFSKQIKALSARFDNIERAGIVGDALSKGRIVPKEWLPDDNGEGGLPIAQLRTLCATLPEIVPLDQRTPEKIKDFSALTPANTADEQVRKNMGISKETWDKYPVPRLVNAA